jgi:hypothetical protein
MLKRRAVVTVAVYAALGVGIIGTDWRTIAVARAQSQLISLRMEIGGGYVFAFAADGKSATLGTIDMNKTAVTAYHQHPMYLRLTRGTVLISDVAPSAAPSGRQAWNLDKVEVAIRPDGGLPADHPLEGPGSTKPETDCDPPTNVNNWFYVPDLLQLIPESKPIKKLTDEMTARIALKNGTLTVADIARGCFTFKDQQGKQQRRLTAHGHEGVLYSTHEVARYIDLVLCTIGTQCGANDRKVIRLAPDRSGAIDLVLRTENEKDPAPNDPLAFFHAYYRLIVDKNGNAYTDDKHPIPTWDGYVQPANLPKALHVPPQEVRTPGGECPPVSIGVPQ